APAGQASPDDRAEDAKRLWRQADFPDGPPRRDWRAYQSDPAIREESLSSLMTEGFVLFAGVPPEPGAVLAVAASMGFVGETNYGRLFAVKVRADPATLASSGRAIAPHTDNPSRDPAPTVQFLHCLASAAEGGDSALVDGFAAASALRTADPAAFAA